MANPPQIAILGAGIFVRTQYIPRLSEISHLVKVKAIWSRTQESASGAVEIASKFFPEVECRWGDSGLDEIIKDASILGVAVVLAGQTQLVGCEVTSVSAMTAHVDASLPTPDNISSVFQLENGCSGVFVMVVSARAPKIFWRVVCSKGTLQIERGNQDGKHGYQVSLFSADGQCKGSFYPFSGVNEEFKSFIHDISRASLKNVSHVAEPRMSFVEGARDVAVLEAMLESGMKHGALVQCKSRWRFMRTITQICKGRLILL